MSYISLSSKSLQQIDYLTENEVSSFSFLGNRRIAANAPGLHGYISLSELEAKIKSCSWDNLATDHMDLKERAAAISLSDKINRYHRFLDTKLKSSSIFFKVVCYIRDFCSKVKFITGASFRSVLSSLGWSGRLRMCLNVIQAPTPRAVADHTFLNFSKEQFCSVFVGVEGRVEGRYAALIRDPDVVREKVECLGRERIEVTRQAFFLNLARQPLLI